MLFIGYQVATVSVKPCDSATPIKNDSGSFEVSLEKNKTCKWEFDISNEKNVYLIIEELILAPGDVASFRNTSHEALQLKGTKSNLVVVLPGAKSSLTLDSTHRALESTATLKFTYNASACNMEVNADAAEISAPHYRTPLPAAISCNYTISGPAGLKDRIWSFREVDLKKGQVVFTSDNETVEEFQDGSTFLPDLVINGTETKIQVNMSTSVEQSGFSAIYTVLENEPTVVDLTKPVTKTNPGFPSGYLGNQDIRWRIKAPDGHFVRVEVSDFDLGDPSDQLVIVDGDSLFSRNLGLLMGGLTIPEGFVVLSSQSIVWMQFKSSARQETSKGFNVTFTPEEFSRALDVDKTPEYFTIETDNATKLPESETIMYQISVPIGERVQVTLNDSILHPLSEVKFYEGWSESAVPLAAFSTNKDFFPVVANGNKVLMVVEGFGNNGTESRQMLEGVVEKAASSESDVYQIMTAKQGALLFSSTNVSVKAVWILQNYEPNMEISLNVKTLKVPKNVYVMVFDGLTDYSFCVATLGQDYFDKTTFPIIRAKTMRVEILDERNSTLADPILFEASYAVEMGCKEDLESGIEAGHIMTPGFPNLYPYNELCEWRMSTGEDSIIRVSFDDFRVFSEHNFMIDISRTQNETFGNHSIIVTNKTTIFSHSGEVLPDDLIVADISDMTFTFDSTSNDNVDDLHVDQGVKVNYEYLTCGGNVTKEGATLSSPGFPANVSERTRCVWIVNLPPAKNNSIARIVKFKLYAGSKANDPSVNTLMIRDGGSKRAPPVPGNVTEGQEVMSRTNIIWVEYVFTPDTNKSSGFPFQLNYTTYDCPPSQQCKNGICMHPDWKCDGYDQCGDHSDEDDCTCVVTKTGAVSYLALGMSILATFVIAVLIACFAPMIYRKIRYGGGYSELRDFMTPVPT